MDKQFLYVFNDTDRDVLLGLGFEILKEDNSPYIFKNKETTDFSSVQFANVKCITKDEMFF